MGYYLSLTAAKFSIPVDRTKEALNALVPFYEGIFRPKKTPRTLGEVFDSFVWPLDRKEDLWVMVDGPAPKVGWQDELFTTVAPFVVDGSYIQAQGEDGQRFEWRFVGGSCRTNHEPARSLIAASKPIVAPSTAVRDRAIARPGEQLTAFSDVVPVVPPALRAMQLAMVRDEWLARALEARHLESVDPHCDEKPNLHGLAPEHFLAFGRLLGGGHVAFWRRDTKAPLAECPVVIFAIEGMVSVYARDFTGFLVLLAHGYSLDVASSNGIRFDDTFTVDNTIMRAGRVAFAATLLTVDAKLFAKMKRWDPEAANRDAAEELVRGDGLLPRYLYGELKKLNR